MNYTAQKSTMDPLNCLSSPLYLSLFFLKSLSEQLDFTQLFSLTQKPNRIPHTAFQFNAQAKQFYKATRFPILLAHNTFQTWLASIINQHEDCLVSDYTVFSHFIKTQCTVVPWLRLEHWKEWLMFLPLHILQQGLMTVVDCRCSE